MISYFENHKNYIYVYTHYGICLYKKRYNFIFPCFFQGLTFCDNEGDVASGKII